MNIDQEFLFLGKFAVGLLTILVLITGIYFLFIYHPSESLKEINITTEVPTELWSMHNESYDLDDICRERGCYPPESYSGRWSNANQSGTLMVVYSNSQWKVTNITYDKVYNQVSNNESNNGIFYQGTWIAGNRSDENNSDLHSYNFSSSTEVD